MANAKDWQRMSYGYRCQVRDALLALKGNKCTLRQPGCTVKFEHVHHTQDRRIVGDDLEYLEPACRNCNLKIGEPTNGDPEPTPRTQW